MLKQIRFPLWSKVSITHLERDWIGTVKQLFGLIHQTLILMNVGSVQFIGWHRRCLLSSVVFLMLSRLVVKMI